MKYDRELYTYCGLYDGDMDGGIENCKEKIVKCRKEHICNFCHKTIKVGEETHNESGFADGKPYSIYCCIKCVENWLEESGQVESEEVEDEDN